MFPKKAVERKHLTVPKSVSFPTTSPSSLDAPWSLQHAAIGRLRGRRFVFDSDALDKLGDSAWLSSTKIESMLGFRPKWNLEKALPEMIQEMEKGHKTG